MKMRRSFEKIKIDNLQKEREIQFLRKENLKAIKMVEHYEDKLRNLEGLFKSYADDKKRDFEDILQNFSCSLNFDDDSLDYEQIAKSRKDSPVSGELKKLFTRDYESFKSLIGRDFYMEIDEVASSEEDDNSEGRDSN